ncbi:hypothetical protein BH09VER1_BH09VER1_45140 [soil metagenome]
MTRFLSGLLIVVLLSGCGYKLGEIRPTPMRSVRTLAVPTFKNKTYQPRVEVLMADTLIKAIQQDGTYTVTSDNTADAIVNCTLTNIDRRSVRSVQNNVLATAEYELLLRITYQVTERTTGIVLMNGTVVGRSNFFAAIDLQTSEAQAIPIAAQNAAEQLTSTLSEGW